MGKSIAVELCALGCDVYLGQRDRESEGERGREEGEMRSLAIGLRKSWLEEEKIVNENCENEEREREKEDGKEIGKMTYAPLDLSDFLSIEKSVSYLKSLSSDLRLFSTPLS